MLHHHLSTTCHIGTASRCWVFRHSLCQRRRRIRDRIIHTDLACDTHQIKCSGHSFEKCARPKIRRPSFLETLPQLSASMIRYLLGNLNDDFSIKHQPIRQGLLAWNNLQHGFFCCRFISTRGSKCLRGYSRYLLTRLLLHHTPSPFALALPHPSLSASMSQSVSSTLLVTIILSSIDQL